MVTLSSPETAAHVSSFFRFLRKKVDHNDSFAITSGYIETDIDTVYLQLRKVIELVMFACIVANKSAGLTLNKTLRKGYEIQKIKSELQRFNLKFFPTPKAEDGQDSDGLRKVKDLPYEERPFMTAEEIFKAYGMAGNYLHSQRDYQYGGEEAKLKILQRGVNAINQLVALLNHHWTDITNDSFFAVVMSGEQDGKVHVSYLERAKTPNRVAGGL
ncbi:hypothetical protein V6259_08445 [Marinomonas sp. TI.3.20]|uniref:hypothetical protein n=1 Tax=Marinomonas sp. TI.3.20 TaxID=3121296 RepID=UPI00311D5B12